MRRWTARRSARREASRRPGPSVGARRFVDAGTRAEPAAGLPPLGTRGVRSSWRAVKIVCPDSRLGPKRTAAAAKSFAGDRSLLPCHRGVMDDFMLRSIVGAKRAVGNDGRDVVRLRSRARSGSTDDAKIVILHSFSDGASAESGSALPRGLARATLARAKACVPRRCLLLFPSSETLMLQPSPWPKHAHDDPLGCATGSRTSDAIIVTTKTKPETGKLCARLASYKGGIVPGTKILVCGQGVWADRISKQGRSGRFLPSSCFSCKQSGRNIATHG